jgi:hypothetical protein
VIALTTQVIEIKDLFKELLNLKLWQGDLHSVRLVKVSELSLRSDNTLFTGHLTIEMFAN